MNERNKWAMGGFVAGALFATLLNSYQPHASRHEKHPRRPQMSEPLLDAAPPRLTHPAQIPDLSPAAESFYANPANTDFHNFIEGIMASLHDDRRTDGRMTADAERKCFGGDRQRMDRAIKAEIYLFLKSYSVRDASIPPGYGITVSGNGESMTVAFDDLRRAR